MGQLVFDHIARSGSKGSELGKTEAEEFAAGIAASVLEERGVRILSALRLFVSGKPCLVSDDALYAVDYALFPDTAEASDDDEAAILASALGKKAFSFPISLCCMEGDGNRMIAGASYIAKAGDAKAMKKAMA